MTNSAASSPEHILMLASYPIEARNPASGSWEGVGSNVVPKSLAGKHSCSGCE